MPRTFTHTRMVEFADTDAAGLMHFSNFFRFMEATEHAFLRSLGTSVHQVTAEGLVGFVRVHAECDYRHPLHFEESIEIELTVRDVNTRSIAYDFAFRKPNGTEAARGSMTVVCVTKPTGSQQVSSMEIPATLRSQLKQES